MIEINNLTNFAVDKVLLTGVAKKVLKGENKGTENISIALVDEAEIKKLNKKYRGKNKSTDVLSFENDSKIGFGLGEVIICLQEVKKNAKINHSTFKKELAKILTHGILHLLGYDHEKSEKEAIKMEKLEDSYLLKFKI